MNALSMDGGQLPAVLRHVKAVPGLILCSVVSRALQVNATAIPFNWACVVSAVAS